VVLVATLITGFLWLAIRLASLALHQRRTVRNSASGNPGPAERTLIYGAGRAGVLLTQNLQEHPRLRCNVLGFIDDDLDKQGLRILGLPVLGPS
jgi:FlaA1/EpsC-like NDP-sugar epimerase